MVRFNNVDRRVTLANLASARPTSTRAGCPRTLRHEQLRRITYRRVNDLRNESYDVEVIRRVRSTRSVTASGRSRACVTTRLAGRARAARRSCLRLRELIAEWLESGPATPLTGQPHIAKAGPTRPAATNPTPLRHPSLVPQPLRRRPGATRTAALGNRSDRATPPKTLNDLEKTRHLYRTAERGCQPYDTALAGARADLRGANDELCTAQRAVDNAGRLHRGRPRAQLAATTHSHAEIAQRLVNLEAQAHPAMTARARAGNKVTDCQRLLNRYQQLTAWEHGPQRLEATCALVRGLEACGVGPTVHPSLRTPSGSASLISKPMPPMSAACCRRGPYMGAARIGDRSSGREAVHDAEPLGDVNRHRTLTRIGGRHTGAGPVIPNRVGPVRPVLDQPAWLRMRDSLTLTHRRMAACGGVRCARRGASWTDSSRTRSAVCSWALSEGHSRTLCTRLRIAQEETWLASATGAYSRLCGSGSHSFRTRVFGH